VREGRGGEVETARIAQGKGKSLHEISVPQRCPALCEKPFQTPKGKGAHDVLTKQPLEGGEKRCTRAKSLPLERESKKK